MSYLASFERIRPQAFRLRWRSIGGTIYTTPDFSCVHYRRYSRLGELLRNNRESEQHFIAAEIEKLTGIRPTQFEGIGESKNTVSEFVPPAFEIINSLTGKVIDTVPAGYRPLRDVCANTLKAVERKPSNREMTESERGQCIAALLHHANFMRELSTLQGDGMTERMQDQFARQALADESLADAIEQAESITLAKGRAPR